MKIDPVVRQPLDPVLIPDNRKHVKLAGERVVGKRDHSPLVKPLDVFLPVQGAVHRVFPAIAPNHFHDVDLTAGRPPHLVHVRAQHPQRRPHALTFRQRSAEIHSCVAELLLAPGHDACGRVSAAFMGLRPCRDDQVTVLQGGVSGKIVLELGISPAVCAGSRFMGPVGLVQRFAAEFVPPDQLHARIRFRRDIAARKDRPGTVRLRRGNGR